MLFYNFLTAIGFVKVEGDLSITCSITDRSINSRIIQSKLFSEMQLTVEVLFTINYEILGSQKLTFFKFSGKERVKSYLETGSKEH